MRGKTGNKMSPLNRENNVLAIQPSTNITMEEALERVVRMGEEVDSLVTRLRNEAREEVNEIVSRVSREVDEMERKLEEAKKATKVSSLLLAIVSLCFPLFIFACNITKVNA